MEARIESPEGIEEVLNVDYEISGRHYRSDLHHSLGFDCPQDMEDPFQTMDRLALCGEHLIFWRISSNAAQECWLQEKLDFEMGFAERADSIAKYILLTFGKSGYSEALVKREVMNRHAEWYATCQERINRLQMVYQNCLGIYESIEKRLSSLQSIAKLQESALLKTGIGALSDGAVQRVTAMKSDERLKRWSVRNE